MPVPAGQLVDLVLRRVRDPWGIATSRAFIRELLTHAQWMVNLASPSVLDVARMETHRTRVIYDLPTIGLTRGDLPVPLADVMRVDRIQRRDGVDLVRLDWMAYAREDAGWMRRTATDHAFWSRLGRDLLVLYPAREDDDAVTLIYVKRTAPFSSDDIVSELRDDRLPAMLALTESLILLHRRLYPAALSAMQTMDAILARLPQAGGTADLGGLSAA